jgi:hypothetical protein
MPARGLLSRSSHRGLARPSRAVTACTRVWPANDALSLLGKRCASVAVQPRLVSLISHFLTELVKRRGNGRERAGTGSPQTEMA